MKNELLRRLSILEEKKIPQVNARVLRGGMQKRLHRQEAIRFKNNINSEKKKIIDRLTLLEQQELSIATDTLGILSSQSIEPLDDFHEPMMRRIRSKRGFF